MLDHFSVDAIVNVLITSRWCRIVRWTHWQNRPMLAHSKAFWRQITSVGWRSRSLNYSRVDIARIVVSLEPLTDHSSAFVWSFLLGQSFRHHFNNPINVTSCVISTPISITYQCREPGRLTINYVVFRVFHGGIKGIEEMVQSESFNWIVNGHCFRNRVLESICSCLQSKNCFVWSESSRLFHLELRHSDFWFPNSVWNAWLPMRRNCSISDSEMSLASRVTSLANSGLLRKMSHGSRQIRVRPHLPHEQLRRLESGQDAVRPSHLSSYVCHSLQISQKTTKADHKLHRTRVLNSRSPFPDGYWLSKTIRHQCALSGTQLSHSTVRCRNSTFWQKKLIILLRWRDSFQSIDMVWGSSSFPQRQTLSKVEQTSLHIDKNDLE
jgi:hypothetical protein